MPYITDEDGADHPLMETTVRTQAELDAAIEAGTSTVYIDSPDGVWLDLRDLGSSHVVARGSSHVVAWGSSHVVAWDSSHVEAWGSSHVVVWDSSHVVAWDSSHVVAWDSSHVVAWGSSHVVAWGSSHVVARGSSHVEAWGSSHVEAWDSSHVEAWDSSHVVAWDSSHVEAWGSSHVEAWDSSHVEAGSHVAVHLHSARAELSGGVVIDLTGLDMEDPATWLGYHGVKVEDGKALVYKAVDAEGLAGHGHTPIRYEPGETVTAPDWQATAASGHGLHFGLTPLHAADYYYGQDDPRFLACHVDAATLIPLGDKTKAESCKVLYEVDRLGVRLTVEAVMS